MKYMITFFLLVPALVWAQLYTEKQSRHRFAQLNYGVDVQGSFGGKSAIIQGASIEEINLSSFYRPRLIIGGTHFWGYADFYVAFSLINSTREYEGRSVEFRNGVETVFKYYPWRLEHSKLRPFLGAGLSVFSFRQGLDGDDLNKGAFKSLIRSPLFTGLTYNWNNQLLDLTLSYNPANRSVYYLNRNTFAKVSLPPLHFSFSYRRQIDTSISAEKNWENGKTKTTTDYLSQKKKLNSCFLGIGASSVFFLKESGYNRNNRPFMSQYPVRVFADLTAGYYWNNLDANVAVNYRKYSANQSAYGLTQEVSRSSVGIEFSKFIGDYHGFVPFVGLIVSAEKLGFKERDYGVDVLNEKSNLFAYGLSLGWDIRPNRLQTWILRTNLRCYPSLNMKLSTGQRINFSNIEFNFIQLIIYPGRMF